MTGQTIKFLQGAPEYGAATDRALRLITSCRSRRRQDKAFRRLARELPDELGDEQASDLLALINALAFAGSIVAEFVSEETGAPFSEVMDRIRYALGQLAKAA